MTVRRLLLTAATAATLITMPIQAYADGTRYDLCMDRAEESFAGCLDRSEDARIELLCWSKFGYQKAWCTLRYIRDIV